MMTGYLIWIAVALSGSTVYSIFTDSGCLDGTTDALQDEQHPDVAGCTGSWHGHIKNGSTLCAPGWRVCSWHNTEHLQTLTYDTATNLTGCFAYNAAQKQGQCKPCVAKVNQDDLAGIGSGCPHQSSGGTSCLSDGGHVSASCCDDVIHRMACHFKSGVTSGVLCCRQPGVAPQIIVNPREMTHVMTGATFVLSCQAMGVPTPSITWSKNGHPLVQGNPRVAVFDSGYLLISEAQLSDSGYYWCRVTNSVGSDDAKAKVVVTDHESGCADGTTDALQQYEDIQGCRGKWSGHVKRAKSLCARGWQVCSPRHNNVIKLLTWADVSETKGCYAYNSANTLNQCSRCHTQGSDMAGVGGGCGRVRRSYRSCLAQGRIDVYKSRLTPGCSYKKSSTTGVMCCRRNNKPPPSLWTAPPKCQPKCSNGGRCISNNRCQCANGYKGVWCQNPICSGGCIPNSVCIKPNTCRCRSGHVGAKCKPRAEQCKATCLNGGRCRNGKCKCPKGWTGTYCHHTVETKHWHKSSDMNRTE